MKYLIFLSCLILTSLVGQSQSTKSSFSLEDKNDLKTYNVTIQPEKYLNKKCIKVIDSASNLETELRLAKLVNTSFQNGVIEVELAGEPMKNASGGARGFVGIAFRIDDSNSKFECFYLRPTNGRADDQVRRNHSAQYISYPEYPWHKLRKEFPEKYESYVDLEVGKWTKVKIEVHGNTAKLFVHDATQPTLIISDLKHGENINGSIGLWIGPGTEAHFRNLVITKKE
jgi:hypothetical protein